MQLCGSSNLSSSRVRERPELVSHLSHPILSQEYAVGLPAKDREESTILAYCVSCSLPIAVRAWRT
jgi:hypothetical protein